MIEIGNILNQAGGLPMMQEAAKQVEISVGGIAVGRVDKTWDSIGLWEAQDRIAIEQ